MLQLALPPLPPLQPALTGSARFPGSVPLLGLRAWFGCGSAGFRSDRFSRWLSLRAPLRCAGSETEGLRVYGLRSCFARLRVSLQFPLLASFTGSVLFYGFVSRGGSERAAGCRLGSGYGFGSGLRLVSVSRLGQLFASCSVYELGSNFRVRPRFMGSLGRFPTQIAFRVWLGLRTRLQCAGSEINGLRVFGLRSSFARARMGFLVMGSALVYRLVSGARARKRTSGGELADELVCAPLVLGTGAGLTCKVWLGGCICV